MGRYKEHEVARVARSCSESGEKQVTVRRLPGQRKWRVYSEMSGRSFGTYTSKAAATKRLQQMEMFKRMRSKR